MALRSSGSPPEPPARWVLFGVPVRPGIAMGIGAPLYLPTPGTPEWLDPRLFAREEEEWLSIDYRMRTEPLEVIALARHMDEVPPILAPYVRIVGWIIEQMPDPPLPAVPVLQVEKLPPILPSDATVIVDANAGVAYIEPNVATLTRYQSQLLRVATHTRYHIEDVHLPVKTWDGQRVDIGGSVEHWDQVAQAVEQGAEIVLVANASPPEPSEVPSMAHQLGGKALWWVAPQTILWEPSLQHSLWRWSAEMSLTLFPNPPDALTEWWHSMEGVKEVLRQQHLPIGSLRLGWLGAPPDEAIPIVDVSLCYNLSELESYWQTEQSALQAGRYRAVRLPDTEPVSLATGLAVSPHAIIVPHESVPDAKERIPCLSASECRVWFLQRLQEGDSALLLAQPEAWIRQRR